MFVDLEEKYSSGIRLVKFCMIIEAGKVWGIISEFLQINLQFEKKTFDGDLYVFTVDWLVFHSNPNFPNTCTKEYIYLFKTNV